MKRLIMAIVVGVSCAVMFAPTTAFAGATSCTDTPGLFFEPSGTFFGRDTLDTGGVDRTAFLAAEAGWIGVAGDWNGDGIDGLAIYNTTTGTVFIVENFTDSPGAPLAATGSFFLSGDGADWWPHSGDWNGNGSDGFAITNKTTGATFAVNDVVSQGLSGAGLASDYQFFLVAPFTDWLPFSGDWNNNGHDGTAIYNTITGAMFLVNDVMVTTGGPIAADYALFMSGDGADFLPTAGRWQGSGAADGTGILQKDSGTFFLANDPTIHGISGGFVAADLGLFIEGSASPLGGVGFEPVPGCWVAE